MNALLDAGLRGVPVAGATLHSTTFPCHNCARHLIGAGIVRVVFIEPYTKSRAEQLHADSATIARSREIPARSHSSHSSALPRADISRCSTPPAAAARTPQPQASQLDAATVQGVIESALHTWEQYANITLTPGQADAMRTIVVEFVSGAHGDAYPFTGPTTLAHTFFPAPPNSEPIAGDMHLNTDEAWSVGSGVDLFSVALHEAGHALGLGHSDRPGAVMYPYYHLASGLTADDIAGIQALYGPPVASTTPSGPPVSNPPAPNPPTPVPPTPTPAPSGGSTPPSLTIVSPAATMVSTSAASLLFSGTASGSVTMVKWSDAFGDAGVATGASSWSVNVPLLVGTNAITVRAYDAAGNSAWRSVTVVRN